MRRRRTTSRKPAKAKQTSKAKKKPARNRRRSVSKDTEVTRLARELAEAREQQAATSEVLQIISSSPGELEPVFQAILENAARLCEAKFGVLFRLEDGAMRSVASLNVPEPLTEFFKRGPHRPHDDAPIMRVGGCSPARALVSLTAT